MSGGLSSAPVSLAASLEKLTSFAPLILLIGKEKGAG